MKNEKRKFEKGITLIALIITIVVLLILAVVAIGSVRESDIIGHAQKAATTYQTKADEENTILDVYLAKIEENLPGGSNGDDGEEDDDSSEEIVWAYVDFEGEEYALYFIGNSKELELVEDKEVKAYIAEFNYDTEEIEYEREQIVTVKLSEMNSIGCFTDLERVTVGKVVKEMSFTTKEIVVLGDVIDVPFGYADDSGIEKIVIKDGVKTIASKAFSKNDLITLTLPASVTSIESDAFSNWSSTEPKTIYYGGTQEQWNAIASAFPSSTYDIKVIFNDGTEIVI